MLEKPQLMRIFQHEMQNTFAGKLLNLLAKGRLTFTKGEIASLFQMRSSAFEDASQRAICQGLLVRPRHGFYAVVPPQYRPYGAPPANQIIDDLMRHERAPYYVGLLKAAEIHGAAHQAVMAFQVVSSKRLPALELGRSRIEFYYASRMPPDKLVSKKHTEAGYYNVSSPVLTATDLLRYPRAAGSLDAAASVVGDLVDQVEASELTGLVDVVPIPTLQRLGYILDRVGADDLAVSLKQLIDGRSRTVELDTFSAGSENGPAEIDDRWKVIVRRKLELDRDSEELSYRMGR